MTPSNHAHQAIRILQWNARSLVHNKPSLQHYLSLNPVTAVAVSETFFISGRDYRFPGYDVIRQDRDDGRGGVALLVKSDIGYQEHPRTISISNFAYVMATIQVRPNTPLTIVSIYNSHRNNIPQRQWETLFRSLPKPFVITGDWNCHNRLVGCTYTDPKGNALFEAAAECDLVYLNDGSPTLVPSATQINDSAIDITFCSTSVAGKFQWQILDDTMGSNHWPALCVFDEKETPMGFTPTRRWNLRRADWEKFREFLASATDRIQDQDLTYSQFFKCIEEACKTAIPENRPNHRKIPGNHWWTLSCQQAVIARRDALKAYKINPCLRTYIETKRAAAIAKRIISDAKKENWKVFCANLNRAIPVAKIWQKVASLSNTRHNNGLVQVGEWVDEFCDRMAPYSVMQCAPARRLALYPPNSPDNNVLQQEIHIKELKAALQGKKGTSPGKDQISYEMLTNLPTTFQLKLVNYFNTFWSNGVFPREWSEFIIVPIKKPGKKALCSSSYRPISLASCVMKTLERIIKFRLQWWVERKNLLPNSQFGFRAGRSTMDAVNLLLTDIQKGLTNNHTTLAAFLDVGSAYDDVDISLLYSFLVEQGLPTPFAHSLISLIRERLLYFRINGKLLGPRTTWKGLPQGCILSSILYALYVSKIENALPPSVKIIQYADDICLYTTAEPWTDVISNLSEAIVNTIQFLHQLGLSLSVSKSVVCPFTRRRRQPFREEIELGGVTFPVTNTTKFLGIHLNRRLSWKAHIDNVILRAGTHYNIMRAVSHSSWGADPWVSLLYYRATIRSIMDYGACFYGGAPDTQIKKIVMLQNKCMRLALGALQSTPTNILHAESGEPPFTLRCKLLTERFLSSIYSRLHDQFLKIRHLAVDNLIEPYWFHKPSPPFARHFTT